MADIAFYKASRRPIVVQIVGLVPGKHQSSIGLVRRVLLLVEGRGVPARIRARNSAKLLKTTRKEVGKTIEIRSEECRAWNLRSLFSSRMPRIASFSLS